MLYNGILAVQIVSHIPLNNVNFPGVSMGFMLYINQAVGFQKRKFFKSICPEFSPSPPINTNFYWMGYETMTFLENMGFISVLFMILVVR